MPIVKNAEQIGTMTLEDGRVIPRYNVKTETTLTNTETGQEYESEEAMQADIDNPNTSSIIKVKNSSKMEPAISLPLKLVEPIFIATNSLPKIRSTNSKLFCPTFTSTGFFFSSVTIFLSSAIFREAMRHHLIVLVLVGRFPHIFVNQINALLLCHHLLQYYLVTDIFPFCASVPPHTYYQQEPLFHPQYNS